MPQTELSDEEVFGTQQSRELSDAGVFGSKNELSDADVFGQTPSTAQPWIPAELQQADEQQAMERNAVTGGAPQGLKNAVEGTAETLGAFIPPNPFRDPAGFGQAVAGLATPVTGSIDELIKDYRITRDMTAGKSYEEAVQEHAPERLKLKEAEKTAPFSKERFQVGTEGVANLLMAKGIVSGLGKAPVKAGEVPKEVASQGEVPSNVPSPSEASPSAEFRPDLARIDLVRQQSDQLPTSIPRDVPSYGETSPPQSERLNPQPENNAAPVVPSTTEIPVRTAVDETAQVAPSAETPVADVNVDNPTGQNAPFVPSTEWQEVPEGTVLPNGGHYKFDQATGKNYARWDVENLPKTEQAPSVPSAPENQPVAPVSQKPEPVQHGEFAQEGYTATDSPGTNRVSDPDPFISRIANRFTEERSKSGEIGEVAPGQGYATSDLVQKGLRMSPEEVSQHVSDIMNDGGGDPIKQAAAIRAEEARLSDRSTELSRVSEANPANLEARQAANAAFQDLTDFHNGPVAKLKTRFHATGMALQGEIPVDLSTFNGLREAWLKDTGKAPPPSMEGTFKRTAQNVRRVVAEEAAGTNRIAQEIEKATSKRRLPSADDVINQMREEMGLGPCRI